MVTICHYALNTKVAANTIETMAKKHRKSTKLNLKEVLVNGLVDLAVGTLLILISKIID